ncbi:PAS domain-containing sensor histidine kinase, partial [Desulfonatronospira sp. MSAO_Bac3]|uniref:PAS domain-containing sensor histidine kinase n=1 Tax=Desulfonatronospira sp. MSAO_Bac3 TaxID=2293857 RepID=UPI000FF79923
YYLQDLSYLTRCIRENTCQELPQYPGLQRKDEVGLLAWALKHRDQDLTRYHLELDTYKNHLEDMVEKRTHELKRSQMLKQTILNSIPDAIALVNAADLTIQDINTAFLERFGLERSQVLGRHCYNIMYGYQAPCHHYDLLCPINEYVQHGKPCITEHRHYNHKNEIIHVEVAAWPVFEENGHVEQLVHVSRDITQKKKVEELREDVERIVRHDLKTPLNGVIGMAELLIEDEDMNSEQREFAGHILESGRNMLHMINHSLDLYKMEEGTYQMRPESFDLQELLQHLRQETSRIRKYKDLQLNFLLNGEPLEEDRQIPVLGEKTNIQSMLANLITNAIEAAPESSQVTVSIQQYAEYMHIDIHNYGTVPEEIRERFFERYATSGKTKGTGLGTFSARLIARSHGGDIDFSTSEDKGTRVRVKLPLNPLDHQLDRTADIVQ